MKGAQIKIFQFNDCEEINFIVERLGSVNAENNSMI